MQIERGEWIPSMGICPVEDNTFVEIEFDNGRTITTNLPQCMDWEIFMVDIDGDNINRYRLLSWVI